MILKKLGIFMASVLFATASMADTLEVNENHPTKYVVQKGDTLWDISGKFLKKPWYWPKIWNVNPQISDPHWIYPGDVLTLVWIDGKPYIKREASTHKDSPIPTINAETVKTFLRNDVILPYDQSELDKLPFVAGNNEERRLFAETKNVYVNGKLNKGQQYGIYHKGQPLVNDDGEKVAYHAIFAGVVVGGNQDGKFNRAYLVKNKDAVLNGDYVLPLNDDNGYNLYFVPKAATVDSSIIALAEESSSVAGQYDTVIVGKGRKDGVSVGDVFVIGRPGAKIVGDSADDTAYASMSGLGRRLVSSEDNVLPDDTVGQAMVYRTYDNVSLAVIMNNSDAVFKGYPLLKP